MMDTPVWEAMVRLVETSMTYRVQGTGGYRFRVQGKMSGHRVRVQGQGTGYMAQGSECMAYRVQTGPGVQGTGQARGCRAQGRLEGAGHRVQCKV